jgi:sugar phosphate isomerase/epimerase
MARRFSFQLYSARNFGPLARTAALLAEAGYVEVEGYGGVYDAPEKAARTLAKAGLSMPSGHFGLDMLESDLSRALDIARAFGMRMIFAPWLDEKDRPKTGAGWRKLGKRLAAINEKLRAEGLGFGWHNHDFEFQALATGEMPVDLLFESAPLIDWECDVAWIARAKANPLAWIGKHGSRITAVHVKDIALKGQALDEDGWADVGHGVMDWAGLMTALRQTRALTYVMEHDNPNDLKRFATRSFAFVSKL